MPPINSIVLIDDDHDDHEIFSLALKEAAPAIECFYFDSAKFAIKKLSVEKNLQPDFIFLDLNMPGMNGIQALEELKKEETISDIPVVVYSTSILPAEKEKALQLGASFFFIKPSSIAELVKSLKEILD